METNPSQRTPLFEEHAHSIFRGGSWILKRQGTAEPVTVTQAFLHFSCCFNPSPSLRSTLTQFLRWSWILKRQVRLWQSGSPRHSCVSTPHPLWGACSLKFMGVLNFEKTGCVSGSQGHPGHAHISVALSSCCLVKVELLMFSKSFTGKNWEKNMGSSPCSDLESNAL